MAINHAVCREKTLCLFGRLEALHLPLSLSGGPMRVLGAVVQVSAAPMPDLGKEFALGHAVTLQPVSDQPARLVLETSEQALEEPLGRTPVPPLLNEDVQHHAMLVYRLPEIMQDAVYAQNTSSRCQVSPGFGSVSARATGARVGELGRAWVGS